MSFRRFSTYSVLTRLSESGKIMHFIEIVGLILFSADMALGFSSLSYLEPIHGSSIKRRKGDDFDRDVK